MRNRKIKKIVNHFGITRQREKLKEECKEFLADPNNFEIADIYNVVVGLHDACNSIQNIAKQKQDRTLHRIKTIPDYF